MPSFMEASTRITAEQLTTFFRLTGKNADDYTIEPFKKRPLIRHKETKRVIYIDVIIRFLARERLQRPPGITKL